MTYFTLMHWLSETLGGQWPPWPPRFRQPWDLNEMPRFLHFLMVCANKSYLQCCTYWFGVHIQMSRPHQFTSSEVRRRQARQDNDRTWFQKRTKMIFIRLQRRAPPLRGKPRASWTLNVHLKCLHHYSCMRFYILSNLMAQLQQDSSKQVTSYFWT